MNTSKQWTNGIWARMAHVKRYSSVPVQHSESVAEHTFYVCMFTYLICLRVKNETTGRGNVGVNMEVALRRAVVHDLDECVTGDIIRTFKHCDPEANKLLKKLTTKNFKEAMEHVPLGTTILGDWSDAKKYDLEGRIVELADLWSVAEYAQREILQGNWFASFLLRGVGNWIGSAEWPRPIKDIAAEIANHAHDIRKGQWPDETYMGHLTRRKEDT